MDTDRNLLFAVLCLQTELLDTTRFAEVCKAWTAAKNRPLADLLLERNWITDAQKAHLDFLLDHTLSQHGGDVHASLAATADDSVRRLLSVLGDSDIDRSLVDGQTTVSDLAGSPPTLATERYTLLRLHAQGGMGRVWLANDRRLGREVALKELKLDDPALQARFLEEAQITGQLQHPGIVPVYELGEADGTPAPFYTMRFVQGRTLREAIADYYTRRSKGMATPLEWNALLEAFVSVCQTLAYAHSRGVLHRDLKPHNIVLGDYGEVLVLDWGLARLQTRPEAAPTNIPQLGTREETALGQVLGTPAYMAPEQAAGRPEEIDARTDIYGLGAILYEILTGRPPFMGKDTHDTLRQVCEQTPTRPRLLIPTVPPTLEAICLKALAKPRERRYAETGELADEVRRYLADEPVHAYAEPFVQRLARWARRHRTVTTTAAALLVTLVLALALGLWAVNAERARTRTALAGEKEARHAEARRRQQAREALDDMTSAVAGDWLTRQNKLSPEQRGFLERALARYEDFARDTSQTLEDRLSVAVAYYNVGLIREKLGQAEGAEQALRHALMLDEQLRNDAPKEPGFRSLMADTYTALGNLLGHTDQPRQADAANQQALALYEELTKDFPADAGYRVGYIGILNNLANAEITRGHDKAAEQLFRRALPLERRLAAESPSKRSYHSLLATTLFNFGNALKNDTQANAAVHAYREALALYRSLGAQEPDSADHKEGICLCLNGLGNVLTKTGPLTEAEADYHEAVVLLQQLVADFPVVPRYRELLAKVQVDRGRLFQQTAHWAEAEAGYRESITELRRLVDIFRGVPDYRYKLAVAYTNLAMLLSHTPRLPEAAKAYHEAAEIARNLIKDFPTIPTYRAELALIDLDLGALLRRQNRVTQATASYRAAIALQEKLVAEFPDRPQYREELAAACGNLGNVLGPAKEAEVFLRKALALQQRLVADEPKNREYREMLGMKYQNLAVYLWGQKDRVSEAEQLCQRAVEIYQELAARFPMTPDYESALAVNLTLLGQFTSARGDLVAAQQHSEAGFRHLQTALKANPNHPTYRRYLFLNRQCLAGVLVQRGQHAQAAAVAEEMGNAEYYPAADRYKAAETLACCVAVAKQDPKLTETKRRQAVRAYGDKAMSFLKQALKKGYKETPTLLADKYLEALGDRDDFKQLVAQLRASKPPAK